MKKNKKIIISVLLVIEVMSVFLMWKSGSKLNLSKDDINNSNIDRKLFAIYLEDGDGYTESNDNQFPEGYDLNLENSHCVDNNNANVNVTGVLVQNSDGTVTVTSNKTLYCYLYFDVKLVTSNDWIGGGSTGGGGSGSSSASWPKGLSHELKGGMYRFQGAKNDVNNYICFGTNNSKDCANNPDSDYLYRIIGITPDGQLKIMKNTEISSNNKTSFDWGGTFWADSTLIEDLNSRIFIGNTKYSYMKDDNWLNKIDIHAWMTGPVEPFGDETYGTNQIADEIYKIENGEKETQLYEEVYIWDDIDVLSNKIGLLYLHDYYYSLDNDTIICDENNSISSNCKNSWMNITNNGSKLNKNYDEWLMTYNNESMNGGQSVYKINSSGSIGVESIYENLAVRPVFYLISGLKLKGSGTLNNPYIIQDKTVGEELKDKILAEESNTGLSDTLIGDMYRYIGTKNDVKNYICFGTDNPSKDCANQESSDYLYRIIGITTDGKLKLLKNSPTKDSSNNTTFPWVVADDERWECSNHRPNDCIWERDLFYWYESDLFKRLNGKSFNDSKYSNIFLDNGVYGYTSSNDGNKWYNLMLDTYWYYGDFDLSGFFQDSEIDYSVQTFYQIERGAFLSYTWANESERMLMRKMDEPAKIGLINVSDYLFSAEIDVVSGGDMGLNVNKNSWMFLPNSNSSIVNNPNGGGDFSSGNSIEYTMTAMGQSALSGYFAWWINSNGDISTQTYTVENYIRPVFYVDSTKLNLSGKGTISNPFIINFK